MRVLLLFSFLIFTPSHAAKLNSVERDFKAETSLTGTAIRDLAKVETRVFAATAKGLYLFHKGQWSLFKNFTSDIKTVSPFGKGFAFITNGKLHIFRKGTTTLDLPTRMLSPKLHFLDQKLYLVSEDELFTVHKNGIAPVEDLRKQIHGNIIGLGRWNAKQYIATRSGLFVKENREWKRLDRHDGILVADLDQSRNFVLGSESSMSIFDSRRSRWQSISGQGGLPYGQFTGVSEIGPNGGLWLGTKKGIVVRKNNSWEYKQGPRWLRNDKVTALLRDENSIWVGTASGVSRLLFSKKNLSEKAVFFEKEIEKRHKRTPFGFVNAVTLRNPDNFSDYTKNSDDNDGLWTSQYGAAQAFAFGATQSRKHKENADEVFNALKFLIDVTQGGEKSPPKGFPARTIVPTSGPDPNFVNNDQEMKSKDPLWKVLKPRWPKSKDGKWYWKADTGSDDLDGHFFFYATYYDYVANASEKVEVAKQVVRIINHLISGNFRLIDWDRKPTRWANFSPSSLNTDPNWIEKRGLNSLSILSYLAVAHHITGNKKYREASSELIKKHGYSKNILTPKVHSGPGTGNQSDDELAFMSFYNLLKYEKDPDLRKIYFTAFKKYWELVQPERNPFFNFLFHSTAGAKKVKGWKKSEWYIDSVESLQKYPWDRRNWAFSNSHRLDVVLLRNETNRGHLPNGKVISINERWVNHWNEDVWKLDGGGNPSELADGTSFLLPYYLGLFHGFIK